MGVLGPIVMGVLGQQQRASGLDATVLQTFLLHKKTISPALCLPVSPAISAELGSSIASPAQRRGPNPAYARSPSTSTTMPSWLSTGSWDFSYRRPCLVPALRPGDETAATLPTRLRPCTDAWHADLHRQRQTR